MREVYPVCPDFAVTTCHTKFHCSAPHCTTCAAASGAASFVRVWKVYKCDKTRKFSNISSGLGRAPALLLPPHFYHCWQRPPGLGWAGPGHADLCLNTPEPLTRPLPGPAWNPWPVIGCWPRLPRSHWLGGGWLAAGSLARPHEVTARGCSE